MISVCNFRGDSALHSESILMQSLSKISRRFLTVHEPVFNKFIRGFSTVIQEPVFNKTVDVVVVGSGASGLTAAVTVANNGLKVLVVEKTGYYGGTTAYSGGGSWIPNNKHQRRLGISDSDAAAGTFLRTVLGKLYD